MQNHGFSVPFSFPVHFTRAAWHPENRALVDTIQRLEPRRRHRVFVVVDEHVLQAQPRLAAAIREYFDAHAESLQLVAAPIVVAGGEAAKNDIVHSLRILQHINDEGLDRQSCIVVIGGGAVLDMVSFAAAIAHRGVRVVRMPTTVLSQADSGIAVKNSINLFGKKNFIGTFVPAFGIINDVEMLSTLPHRDKIAGISEAVKVSLLRDAAFYNYLEANAGRLRAADETILPYVVQRSAELHLAHICGNGDPFELGSARPLDFGHWVAHKLESMTGHRLRHGEAVAIGMAVDLLYSHASGLLDRVTMERILSLLRTIGFRLWDETLFDRAADGRLAVLDGLQEFRQHLGGELHVTLLRGIGTSVDVTEMDEQLVVDAIDTLSRRDLAGAASGSARAAARP
jgi:3-dehydroquinate synthase